MGRLSKPSAQIFTPCAFTMQSGGKDPQRDWLPLHFVRRYFKPIFFHHLFLFDEDISLQFIMNLHHKVQWPKKLYHLHLNWVFTIAPLQPLLLLILLNLLFLTRVWFKHSCLKPLQVAKESGRMLFTCRENQIHRKTGPRREENIAWTKLTQHVFIQNYAMSLQGEVFM